MSASEYVVIDGATLPVNTVDEIAAAAHALTLAGVNQTEVWATPHALDWIAEHGDPDGVLNGRVLLADTDVDPVANGTAPDPDACTCATSGAYLCLRCERIAESQDIGF